MKIIQKMGLVLLVGAVLLCGCGKTEPENKKVRDLEYSVICEDRLPEELHEQIKEHKAQAFELSYSDGNFLYLARGYGEQPTGGYSIRVNDFYLAEDGIVFRTELIGPQEEEQAVAVISTPFIVVKTEKLEETDVID